MTAARRVQTGKLTWAGYRAPLTRPGEGYQYNLYRGHVITVMARARAKVRARLAR